MRVSSILFLAAFAAPWLVLAPPASGASAPASDVCFIPPPGAALWSNPASWQSGTVPQAGECRTIPAGTTMYLDVSTAPLGGLDIQGELVFLCGNHTLTSDWILVTGKLEAGNAVHPFHHEATIRLTDDYACDPTKENQTLAVEGQGLLRLIGKPRAPSWTRLAATAVAGSSVITLQVAPAWRTGQTILIASTDFDLDQAEERTIQSVSGNQVTLTQPLAWTHWGATEGQDFDGVGVEQRAEVALLERTITVEGTPTLAPGGQTIAGHTILRNATGAGPRAELEWTEFRELGKEGTLGKYPLHFHQIGDATGSFVRHCSIHHTYNRSISIHTTQNVAVTGNLSYEARGHAYYMEDDPATGCTLTGNLGLSTRVAPFPVIESDATPSTFWLISPDNVVEGNAAAGSEAYGFWLDTLYADPTPWTAFRGNVAHSNEITGFYQDTRPQPAPESVYEDLTSYKNRRYGIWLRSYGNARVRNARLADNRGGFYLASEGFQFNPGYYPSLYPTGISTTVVEDGLVIGETGNVGTPATCYELAVGRSLPQVFPNGAVSMLPSWTALTGVELYDGLVGVEGTIFAEFRDKSVATPGCGLSTFDRKAGAISQVDYNNPWALDPRNYVLGVTFVQSASTTTIPVHFRTPNGYFPWSCGTIVDDGGIANTILQDRDGSLTGTAGSVVFPDNDFLIPYSGATFDAAWNAFVTSGAPSTPFAQLDFIDLSEAAGLTPVDAIAVNAPVRNQWFVKWGPVLDLCQPTEQRLAHFPLNVVTDDIYEVHYDPAVAPADWPRVFMLTLQFTEPGRWAYVTVPLLPPIVGPGVIDVNGVAAPAAPDPLSLYNGPGNEWYYDSVAQRLHMKVLTGGTGTTIYDGLRTTFLVISL